MRAHSRRACRRCVARTLRCGHRGDRMIRWRLYVAFAAALMSATATIAGPVQAPGAALAHLPSGVEAAKGPVRVRVTALTDWIIRVRVARDGKFAEDSSWAVPGSVRRLTGTALPTDDGFRTGAIIVHLDPGTLELRVADLSGRTILADAPGALRFDGTRFALRKDLPIDEHIYGLGDKTGPLDRRGGTFVDWDTDAYGFAPSSDPIYKSIPFFIGVSSQGSAYGLFLDNSWRV